MNGAWKAAKAVYADGDDFGFVDKWREKLGEDPNALWTDSVEFARLAQYRYSAHHVIQPYVQAVEDFERHVEKNSRCEVAAVVLLKCDWFPDSETIGIVHFRRTWSNRLVLDYLCAHPFITEAPLEYANVVNGVGSALLYIVTQIAKARGSDAIWGEATEYSWGFYQKVLKLDSVNDLIYAPRKNFLAFSDKLESDWAGKETKKGDAALKEIYQIEVENPPFVGNKAAVYNPPRKLISHFFDLPLYLKAEVAESIGFQIDISKMRSDSELFSAIFQEAMEHGKLPDLWREIESRHPKGEPDNNPFQ